MKKTVKKVAQKKSVSLVSGPTKVKLKIRQAIGMKVGDLPNGQPDYQNVFLEFSEKQGTEVEISSALKKRYDKVLKDFLSVQAELKKSLEG